MHGSGARAARTALVRIRDRRQR